MFVHDHARPATIAAAVLGIAPVRTDMAAVERSDSMMANPPFPHVD